jgi:hypothetical protein
MALRLEAFPEEILAEIARAYVLLRKRGPDPLGQ